MDDERWHAWRDADATFQPIAAGTARVGSYADREPGVLVHWVRATPWPNAETHTLLLACFARTPGHLRAVRGARWLAPSDVNCIGCLASDEFLAFG